MTWDGRGVAAFGAVVLWAVAVASGMGLVWRHAATPGASGSPPTGWPEKTRLHFQPGHWHVIVVCHPYCPCTGATLEELARVMVHAPANTQVQVVISRPGSLVVDWSALKLRVLAERLPHAAVVIDEEGGEPAVWGVQTSGHVLVYTPDGQLHFSGGITASRGHEGGNGGADAVRGLLNGQISKPVSTPVFGCPLAARPMNPDTEHLP
jgi:hypothetical protein